MVSGGNGDGRNTPLLETLAAQDGTPLRWLERYGGFSTTGRAVRPRFRADRSRTGGALGFACFAAFWVVFELLIVKEKLFAGGEYKVAAAVAAIQDFIGKVHGLPPTDASRTRPTQSFPNGYAD